jgi:hypothetical protein
MSEFIFDGFAEVLRQFGQLLGVNGALLGSSHPKSPRADSLLELAPSTAFAPAP